MVTSWKQKRFENCGVAELASTGRSLKIQYEPDHSTFSEPFYISLKDLDDLRAGKKKTVTPFRLIEDPGDAKENQVYGRGEESNVLG